MRQPGIIIKLNNDMFIVYNNQPLKQEKGKIILHFIDEDYKQIVDDIGKPKVRILDVHIYNMQMEGATLVGYCD